MRFIRTIVVAVSLVALFATNAQAAQTRTPQQAALVKTLEHHYNVHIEDSFASATMDAFGHRFCQMAIPYAPISGSDLNRLARGFAGGWNGSAGVPDITQQTAVVVIAANLVAYCSWTVPN